MNRSRSKGRSWQAIRRSLGLGTRGGGSPFLLVFMFFFFTLGIFGVFMNIVKNQHRVAAGHRDQSINLQLADSMMDQVLSKIRNREVLLPLEYSSSWTATPTPAGTPTPGIQIPVTVAISVGVGGYNTQAKAKIDFVWDASPTPQPIRDIEGNLKYQMDAVVSKGRGIGTNTKLEISRGIRALFVVVNFGRYMSFAFENDNKSFGGGSFNGPYHCNKSVTMSGNCDWNNSVLSFASGVSNPFYDKSYTTVVGGAFVDSGSMDYNSQANQNALPSNNGSYNILTNSVKTDGTWIDGARGGFAVNLTDIPYAQMAALSHVVLQKSLLNAPTPTYNLQGSLAGAGSVTLANDHLIDAGINGVQAQDYPVRINLSALNKPVTGSLNGGTIGDYDIGDGLLGKTATDATNNYETALASQYGIVIYVDGDAAIWGQLPETTNPTTNPINKNKKVTIICTGNAQIIGDVLCSKSRYVTTTIASNNVDPNPTIDNPNQDAIAILSGGNVYVNPWRRGDDSFFVKESTSDCDADMRLQAFLYAPRGVTGGNDGTPGSGSSRGNQSYKAGGENDIEQFTFLGAIVVETSGYLPSCNGYYRYYDPNMKYNISSIIPSGTSVTSWQEVLSPPKL